MRSADDEIKEFINNHPMSSEREIKLREWFKRLREEMYEISQLPQYQAWVADDNVKEICRICNIV